MNRKTKQELISNIIELTSDEHIQLSCLLKEENFLVRENELYNTKLRIGYFQRYGRFNNRKREEGYFLNRVLKLPVSNDAPRGGASGEYIVIKNTKLNREKIEFIREFLKIY